MLGPLDMYYLPYFRNLYHQRHIPIHYVLLAGVEGQSAYVYDNDRTEPQLVPIEELRLSWDVNVPGLGKKNRLAIFDIPETLPSDETLIRRSIRDRCQTMLHPPMKMIGISGMQQLAGDILRWLQELGESTTARCLLQMREYLNTPLDLSGNRLTAARDLNIVFLEEAGSIAGLDVSEVVDLFQQEIVIFPKLAQAVERGDLVSAAEWIKAIAELESKAYNQLSALID